jgi:hypothetical protein
MGSLIRLTPVVRSDPVALGSKSRVVIGISEGTGNSLKRVRVQVKGPKGAIRESVASVLRFHYCKRSVADVDSRCCGESRAVLPPRTSV